ncbi:hypothetical protein C1645_878377 [Glomus cerebriforme]|uniref:Uncharacterized protein n=1 Tax=Glomus cerebriforme TaxID=658196 RepID=A0A397SVI5_9GLOM|nr:hypothetical protein C1645_878377 [Glomus cerebriforme]
MEIDGAMIPIATPWDALALFYTINIVGEVNNDFRANAHKDTTMADSIKCGVEIKRQGNHEDLVQSVDNREQEYQKTNNKVLNGSRFRESSSLFSGQLWEFGKESNALAVQKNIRNEIMLRELPNDDGMQNMQNTHDLASLIRLLKDKEPYRDETNKDVLTKEDHDHGIIYFWSRINDSMIRRGENLKEALTNYLFNQENLCYVDEITRELVPINAYDKEAEEWVKSPKAYINIDVTKVLQKHE